MKLLWTSCCERVEVAPRKSNRLQDRSLIICVSNNIFHDFAKRSATNQPSEDNDQSTDYTAKGTFTSHNTSIQSSIAEAPDISAFQLVTSKPSGSTNASTSQSNTTSTSESTSATINEEKKKKKKKKSSATEESQTFELPQHLIPLESDTPAQKLKKARTAKSLKSKFRSKQKEVEATKKANDWKSFATKTKKKSSSIFSTEEGVNARVGVVSGGGTRGMTEFEKDQKKRHNF